MYGQGVPQDYREAFHWFSRAAEKHYLAGQASLGYLYEKGLGIPHDCDKALKYLTKPAKSLPFSRSRI